MSTPEEIKAYVREQQGKAQIVRVADVFFVGPLMIYGGRHLRKKQRLPGMTLEVLGWLTILYNGYNYLRLKDHQ